MQIARKTLQVFSPLLCQHIPAHVHGIQLEFFHAPNGPLIAVQTKWLCFPSCWVAVVVWNPARHVQCRQSDRKNGCNGRQNRNAFPLPICTYQHNILVSSHFRLTHVIRTLIDLSSNSVAECRCLTRLVKCTQGARCNAWPVDGDKSTPRIIFGSNRPACCPVPVRNGSFPESWQWGSRFCSFTGIHVGPMWATDSTPVQSGSGTCALPWKFYPILPRASGMTRGPHHGADILVALDYNIAFTSRPLISNIRSADFWYRPGVVEAKSPARQIPDIGYRGRAVRTGACFRNLQRLEQR
jgi:hypothetical protein